MQGRTGDGERGGYPTTMRFLFRCTNAPGSFTDPHLYRGVRTESGSNVEGFDRGRVTGRY